MSSSFVFGNVGRPRVFLRASLDFGILYTVPVLMIFSRNFLEKSGIYPSYTAIFFKARITSATLTPWGQRSVHE